LEANEANAAKAKAAGTDFPAILKKAAPETFETKAWATIGFNVETVEYKNISFTVWDVGGQDKSEVDQVLAKLKTLPPLVHHQEIENLKTLLGEVENNQRFLLQGGDCAESFNYCNSTDIENKLKVLIQMSLVLTYGGRTPLVRIIRGAGQYAKPRSKPTEMVEGEEILAFRGDNINGFEKNQREHNPKRLLDAYFHSASTWNYVRALLSGGFADLHQPNQWTLDHVKSSSAKSEYEALVNQMLDSLDFMKTIRAEEPSSTRQVEMFSSHEGLILDYEQSMTRKIGDKWYNVGAHFLWIGDRTRDLKGAHIEYFRGISNPIGVKVGPSMQNEELINLIKLLNPAQESGRITLITRYGANKVAEMLPKHIKAVQEAGLKVVWCCDPMHGNTEVVSSGLKTRRFDNILKELSLNFSLHKQNGSRLGGVHFELTGDGVTECIGGSMEMNENDLQLNYQTFCDPRLNYEQSLDMAFLISKIMEEERLGTSAKKRKK